MDDMNCTKNEDDLEEAEMRLLQRQLDQGQHVTESQEEKDYKAEFFELLDEVNSLLSIPFKNVLCMYLCTKLEEIRKKILT